MQKNNLTFGNVFAILIIILLTFVSHFNFLLFHTFSELISITIGFCIVIIAVNSYGISKNSYFTFIAIAYGFADLFSLLHLLTYKGMNIIPGYSHDISSQLWICSRYMESISILTSFRFIQDKELKIKPTIVMYTLITFMLFLMIFNKVLFPGCYIEGVGLTGFKIISEIIIAIIYLQCTFLTYKNRRFFSKNVFDFLTISLMFSCFSDLSFIYYKNLYGLINKIGHIFLILSVWFLYKAIVETTIKKPFKILFKELHLAKQQSESANQIKSDFIASLSHELRTPLNAIIGFSDILLNDNGGKIGVKQEKYINNIAASGKHLLALVNDLLDISKIEAGKMELIYENFNSGKVIQDIVTGLKSLALKKKISVKIKLRDINVNADLKKFKQIIYNLLSNAIKYTPEGGKVLVHSDINESKLVVSVEDTGIGIAEKDYEQIFSHFKQIDSSYTKEQEGSGLGLSLTKKLVEMHNGSIYFNSELGKGSRFWFILPDAKVKLISKKK